jgi:hypothetical protein
VSSIRILSFAWKHTWKAIVREWLDALWRDVAKAVRPAWGDRYGDVEAALHALPAEAPRLQERRMIGGEASRQRKDGIEQLAYNGR